MKKFDDIVIIRRSHSDTRSGKHSEVFAVTYLGNNDIGTECHTRDEADAQAKALAAKKKVAVWYEHDPGGVAVQKNVRSRHSRRIVPMSRSTNGCESGAYGPVLISSTSRMRKFACHWWNWYSRSWSELRDFGGVRPGVARLNCDTIRRHPPRRGARQSPRCDA